MTDLMDLMAPYAHQASWAVWPVNDRGELTGDLSFPQDVPRNVLHGHSMIVSLNPATRAQGASAVEDWSNFHSNVRKHNDEFLAYAFRGTDLWGSYMVDLHPAVAESNSAKVIRATRNSVDDAVTALIEQARTLGEVSRIVCVGRASYLALLRRRARLDEALPSIALVRIPHYSNANARQHKRNREIYGELVASATNNDARPVEA